MSLVGVVVVSHSRRLAQAAVDLAMQMVHAEAPNVVVAAGLPDEGLGTDAMAIQEAIEQANAGAGVVILTDLGSAILNAEMALEFLGEPDDVRLVPAPFVEGVVASVVQAATGASLDAVAAEASRALMPKQEALGEDDGLEQVQTFEGGLRAELLLRNPAGMHARPAARIVAEAARFDAAVRIAGPDGHFANASSPIALSTLRAAQGDVVQIETSGPQAEDALEALTHLVEEGFGELTTSVENALETTTAPHEPVGVSPGRVVGPAYLLVPARDTPPDPVMLDPDEVEGRVADLDAAIDAVAEGYAERAAEGDNREASEILEATVVLARDQTLRDEAVEFMRGGRLDAPSAFWKSAGQAADMLIASGGRMAERTTDLFDIRNRVISHLLDEPMPGLPSPGEPYVLLARDVAPSDAAQLDAKDCLAIVTTEGGRTSHTSILARGMGIPAVVGYPGVMDIPDGTLVLVDGDTSEVVVDPDEKLAASARRSTAPMEALAGPGQLADGTAVSLLANVNSVAAAEHAREAKAEGVGLFRTEFGFLNRAEEPSIEEQVGMYSDVLRQFAGKRVVIRTLDAGSDKPIPFLGMPDEENPALGVRGFRTAMLRPQVLRRQLQAIATAVEQTGVEAWTMAPMISTRDEAREFVDLAREAGLQQVGIMIETPSAAVMAREVLDVVDFVSIGTNDLTQYAMAADRLAPQLSGLQEPWQPAVLRLIRGVGDAGRELGKHVGVCGEAAADAHLAPVLVGLGVDTLSMTPRALSLVGRTLAGLDIATCREAAAAACASDSPEGARQVASAVLQF